MTLLLMILLATPDAGTPARRPYVDEVMTKVRKGTVDTESERDHVKPEDISHFAREYFATKKWPERVFIIELVQDSKDPVLTEVMWDALDVPNCDDDTCWWVRAVALSFLDGDFAKFSKYFEDRKLCREVLARRLKERAKRKK